MVRSRWATTAKDRALIAKEDEATIVRQIYDLYLEHGTVRQVKAEADKLGLRSKQWTTKAGRELGGLPYTRGHLYRILTNPIYVGMVHQKGTTYDGQHDGIVDPAIWQQVQNRLRIGEQRQAEDANANQDVVERSGTDGVAGSPDDRALESNSSDCNEDVAAHEHHVGIMGDEQSLPDVGSEAGPTTDQQYLVPSPARPKRSYRTASSPLVGKVFDETADRLTPSHANKKGRRYRYYISNRLIVRSGESERNEGREEEIGGEVDKPIGGWRLPAATLEQAIADAIQSWLADPILPSRLMIDASADEQVALRNGIERLVRKLGSQNDPIVMFAPAINRVDLQPGYLSVTLGPKAMADLLHISASDRIDLDAMTISTTFDQRRRGVETRMVLGHTEPQIDTMLINNLAQARSWYAQLKTGSSLATIAQQDTTTVALITRILPLAFLSPSIVEAICSGQQPPELTSRKLRDITIPAGWNEQTKLFEIA